MNKKELKNIIYFIKLLLLFCLSSYICLLIFPLIKIKYSNPNNFIGVLSKLEFNPLNNTLGYIFYILATPSLFLFFKKILDSKKYLWLRYIFIFALIFSFFLSLTTFHLQQNNNLQMYHDGEQLGVGSAVYFFNKTPYKDMFFWHGAFSDPLEASIAFKIFRPSIGSFYLLKLLLMLVSFALFFIMLTILIKDQFIFYVASIFFYGSLFHYTLSRDLTTYIYLLVAILVLRKIIKEYIGFFILSFIAFFTFYYTVDRGYYLSIINIAFFIIFSLLKTNQFYQFKNISQIIKQLQNNAVNFIAIISGTIAANMLGILFFGSIGFLYFFRVTFFHLPLIKSFVDERPYPLFSSSTLFPNWLPIILICSFLSFVIYYIKYRKKEVNIYFVLPILFTLFSVLFFRSALGRSDDITHILYVVHYIFLTGFIILDYLLIKKMGAIKKMVIYFTSVILFLIPFFNFNRIINLSEINLSNIKIFFALPTIDDNYWLNSEKREVKEYILSHTLKSDKIFVFTNASAYYYLFNRDNPTRYYTIQFAIGDKFQKEAIIDLENNKPKYIIYKDGDWGNAPYNISNSEKLPLIDKWITSNYELDKKIYSTEIYILKQNILKSR